MSEPVTHEDEARAMEEIRLAMDLLYLTIQAIAEAYPYLPPTAISTAMINVGAQHGISHQQSTSVADYLHGVAEMVTRGRVTHFTGGDDVRH
ncbi:hypothetical protein [Insolitispirillum peregrinum]